jgi:hypothetical protein
MERERTNQAEKPRRRAGAPVHAGWQAGGAGKLCFFSVDRFVTQHTHDRPPFAAIACQSSTIQLNQP